MQWLAWTGGVVAMAGLAWLMSSAELSTGGPDTLTAAAAIALFLGGLVLMALGMRAGIRDT